MFLLIFLCSMMRLKNAERWQKTLLRDIPITMKDGQPINRYVNFSSFSFPSGLIKKKVSLLFKRGIKKSAVFASRKQKKIIDVLREVERSRRTI